MNVLNKPFVYIASPYTKGNVELNVKFQLKIWDQLISENNCWPIAPLWSHFQHLYKERDYYDWVNYDNALIIKACDVCLRLTAKIGDYEHDDSPGADAEVKLFHDLNRPVFYSLEDLNIWLDSKK